MFQLSVYLLFFWSVCHLIYLSIYHSFDLCRSIYPSVFWSVVDLSIYPTYLPTGCLLFNLIVNLIFSFHLSLNLSIFVCLSSSASFYPFIYLLVVLSICLSFHQPFLSTYCFVFLSFCLLFHSILSIYCSVVPSIHLTVVLGLVLYLYHSVCLLFNLSICCICPPFYPSIVLSVIPSVRFCQSVCPSIYCIFLMVYL